MALATQGSTIKKPFYPTPTGNNPKVTGVFAPTKTSLSAPTPTPTPQSTQAVKIPFAPGVNQTVQQDAQGNKYSAPKSNPSVLAQQQQINEAIKKAGGTDFLITDGIAGDKTRAALAKYGSGGTGTTSGVIKPPSTPVPEKRDSKGLLVNPLGATHDRNTGQEIVTPPEPPKIDTQSNAERVIDSGQQTQNEQATQARLLELSKNPSEEYNQAQGIYEGYLGNYNKLLQDQQKSLAAIGQEAIPLQFQQGRQQVLQNQYAGQISGAGSALSAATSALGAANTQQGLQQGAASSAYGGAQTQASRVQGGAGTVFGAGLVSPTTPGQAAFSPLSGYQGGSGNMFGNPNDPASQSNYQSYIKAVSDNNAIGVASSIFNDNFDKAITDARQVSSILTPEQRKTPIESLIQLITNGVLGTSPVLSGLVNDITAIKTSYKQATGNDLIIPPTATLDQLNTIKSSAQSAIKAAQDANQKLIDKYSNSSSADSGTKVEYNSNGTLKAISF